MYCVFHPLTMFYCPTISFHSLLAASRKAKSGCNKCGGSRKEPCNKCGGGGLLVPMMRRSSLPVRTSDDNGRRITALAPSVAPTSLATRSRLMLPQTPGRGATQGR
eukprot:TRINITY_DN1233_c0_g1_i14.p2 TRINITY_DN1233_c0_g1~~TRINITY_DN1233_c0_g1_i14.p2  ORF type:complete len:106 (-),score=2.86 TRINITY_DN1233_c0_g1_i14:362-679(-)